MKKLFFTLFIAASVSAVSFSQNKEAAPQAVFTKAEVLGFADLKSILSAINKGQDYSKYIVRNFKLTTVDAAGKSVSEIGPGGVWSEKQKALIEQYAKKGAQFSLDNIIMIESGQKGMIEQPSVSFFIKE